MKYRYPYIWRTVSLVLNWSFFIINSHRTIPTKISPNASLNLEITTSRGPLTPCRLFTCVLDFGAMNENCFPDNFIVRIPRSRQVSGIVPQASQFPSSQIWEMFFANIVFWTSPRKWDEFEQFPDIITEWFVISSIWIYPCVIIRKVTVGEQTLIDLCWNAII